jgi:hypothetical protein
MQLSRVCYNKINMKWLGVLKKIFTTSYTTDHLMPHERANEVPIIITDLIWFIRFYDNIIAL